MATIRKRNGRWQADAHGYRNKSKALRQLLETVHDDRSKLRVIR